MPVGDRERGTPVDRTREDPIPPVPEVATPEPEPTPAVEPPPPPSEVVQEPAPPPPEPTAPAPKQSAGAHMREVVQEKKRARLEKIVVLAGEKRVITNNDVEKLLKVSDATATNYLRELVKEGRLKKNGVRAGTRYEPV